MKQPKAYFNEIDPYAAEWLRNLIAAEYIAHGDVDTRSIIDVKPSDLAGYSQCHFFAGIGVWSYALRRAGWPDSREIWTGSCPCQPFSQSGKGGGFDDERHLWPSWYWLIEQCRPAIVLGEQVASPDGLAWLDLVQTDLEAAHYTGTAFDLCSAGAGAPHIRQRLYFVAHTNDARSQGWRERGYGADQWPAWPRGLAGWLADANGRNASAERQQSSGEHGQQPQDGGVGQLGVSDSDGRFPRRITSEATRQGSAFIPTGSTGGFWRDADWLYCTDGKYRPVEPGTFPLAHGAASRVGRLRAYGNAVNAEVTKEFIVAVMECMP